MSKNKEIKHDFLLKNHNKYIFDNNNGIYLNNCILIFAFTQKNYFNKKEEINELISLVKTNKNNIVDIFSQNLYHIDPKFYIGKGKALMIYEYINNLSKEKNIDMIIFNRELKGSQIKNLENLFKCNILDKSMVIMNIFAMHARSYQSKLQVLLAQYQYLLPRLTHMWTHLEKQKGGIGMKGPGEQEIETDRRIIRKKISLLKSKLKNIEKSNFVQSKNRNSIVRVSLVGYTNAGKSTIMNLISNANVKIDNQLFSTLDTKVKKVIIKNIEFLISDTVGFINDIPHHLIQSFKSTLLETRYADIIIHVIDASSHNIDIHINTVINILKDLKIKQDKIITVFNKIDKLTSIQLNKLISIYNPFVYISAINNTNIDKLKLIIHQNVIKYLKMKF